MRPLAYLHALILVVSMSGCGILSGDEDSSPLARVSASPSPSLAVLSGEVNSSTRVTLSWSSVPGTNVVLVVASGNTIPNSCEAGAEITNTSPYSVTGLEASSIYSFILCRMDAGTRMIATNGVTLSTTTQVIPSGPQQAEHTGSGSDTFGFASAVSGSKALVGTPWINRSLSGARGAVEAFELNNGVWSHTQTLTASAEVGHESDDDAFGSSIAIGAGTAVVGAPLRMNLSGDDTIHGAAFYFEYDSIHGGWTRKALLKPTSVDHFGNQPFEFGKSVAINNGVIAVGAPAYSTFIYDSENSEWTLDQDRSGAVFLYTKSGNNWNETKVVASDWSSAMQFGASVGLSGGELFVGASEVGTFDNGTGIVYIYQQSSSWGNEVQIMGPLYANNIYFGKSLAVNGTVLAVGDPGFNNSKGAVHVFRKSGNSWTLSQSINAPGVLQMQFGSAVAVNQGRLLIGAPADQADSSSEAGRAYLYRDSAGTFAYSSVFSAAQPSDYIRLGSSVSLSGSVLLLGTDVVTSSFEGDGQAYFMVDSDYTP